MTPEELRNAFIKSRGLNLTSTPVPPPAEIPVAPPTPVQTVPITPTPPAVINPDEPFRMPSQEAVEAWRSGANRDIAAGNTNIPTAASAAPPPSAAVAVPPVRVPSAFPAGGTAPIVATRPVIEQAPGGGVSLASNPVAAPGWAGTVGLPSTPEESKWWEKGAKNSDLMAGLEQIAKGVKPKADKSDMNTITPSNLQPNSGQANSAELMNAVLQGRRRKYGISLAG